MKIRNPCDFNVIRLTFSIQMAYENPIIDKKLTSANPQFEGKTAL